MWNNKFVQYKLWSDCSNNCRFCMNQLEQDADKSEVLDYYIKHIEDGELDDYNELGIQGGEFFNGQLEEVHDKFYHFIGLICDYMKGNRIQKFNVTTGLIFPDLSEVYEFLDFVKARVGLDHLLLCTSYDTIYRFHNKRGLQLWENAIDSLHARYPELKIHVETILTQDFLTKVLNKEFDIPAFAERFKVHVDYLEPFTDHHGSSRKTWITRLPNFYPKRETFIQWLKYVADNNLVDMKSLLNRNIRSHTAYILINGKPHPYCNRQLDERSMGGVETDPGYCDSDIPMNYDVIAFRGFRQ